MSYKVVFFGSFHHSLLVLHKLASDSLYELIGIVSQPAKPVGRKQILTPTPVSLWACEHRVPLLTPNSWKKDACALANLRSLGADFGVLAIYGKILPQSVLDIFPFGIINIHPSLLPFYRGPAPAVGVILHGDRVSGVSIIKLVAAMDAGPILGSKEFFVADNEIPETYYHKSFQLGADLLLELLPLYLSGSLRLTEQDHARATFTHLLSRKDGKINWGNSAVEIERHVRAMTPWPGAWTEVWVDHKGTIFFDKEMGERLGLPYHTDNFDGLVHKRMKILGAVFEDGVLRLTRVQIEGETPRSF